MLDAMLRSTSITRNYDYFITISFAMQKKRRTQI